MFSAATIAFAQSTLPDRQTDENSSRDVTQPQGKTGPTETKSGGAQRYNKHHTRNEAGMTW
jgi:hypothetical protein